MRVVHFCVVACLCCTPARAEVIDRVLAVVSGRPIMLSDVTAAVDLGLVAVPEAGDRVRIVLAKLIDRELQLAEVDRYAPPEPSSADIEREVQNVRSRFTSVEAFETALARSGLDVAQLRQTVREDLIIRAYLDQRFSARQERRDEVVEQWIAGLRRRADIVDLYARQPMGRELDARR
ncbi:MAG TPA: hypothetical protein VM818_13185 [Vicinamibacterales bacterium]|nr:hypothetical protein [Vicinamibacterales bacterium]